MRRVNHSVRQLHSAAAARGTSRDSGRVDEIMDATFARAAEIPDFADRPQVTATGPDPLHRAFALMARQRLEAAAGIFVRHASSRRALRALESRRALGDLERMRGRYTRAARWLATALARAAALEDPVQLALTFNSLGMLSKYVAHFEQGRRYYARALRLAARFDPPEPALLASIHHNLGGLENSSGRYAAGEPHARAAVRLRMKVRGAAHPDVAEDRASLAAILDGAGHKREAEQLYRSVLPVFERAGMRYDVAVNLNNLGTLLEERGHRREAQRILTRALRIERQLFGAAHPDIAITLTNLGALTWGMGDVRAAEALLVQAQAMMMRLLGGRHPSTRSCREVLAQVRAAQRTAHNAG
jgi:tetratricopeptide (TPR) repeat protein